MFEGFKRLRVNYAERNQPLGRLYACRFSRRGSYLASDNFIPTEKHPNYSDRNPSKLTYFSKKVSCEGSLALSLFLYIVLWIYSNLLDLQLVSKCNF